MIKEHDNFFWYKLNGLARYILAHTATNVLPLYVVNEYPKSGGSWLAEMLGSALGVPFPRNRLPILGKSILHGHMIHGWNMHNIVTVWRDGRDVLVSQYYHYLFENDRGNGRLVEQTRRDLRFADYSDIKGNLPRFIRYVYTSPRHPRFSWTDFGNRWARSPECCHVTYESLRRDPVTELRRVVKEITGCELSGLTAADVVQRHSFARVSGRQPGQENVNSFLRKGVVGDWRAHFSPEAKLEFDTHAGDLLIRLGYELSHEWARTPHTGVDVP